MKFVGPNANTRIIHHLLRNAGSDYLYSLTLVFIRKKKKNLWENELSFEI